MLSSQRAVFGCIILVASLIAASCTSESNLDSGDIAALFNFNYVCNHFIDANAGSDSNDGLTINTPWRTFERAASESRSTGFSAGDAICLKRGQRFVVTNPSLGGGSSGADGKFIYYGAYGDTADPLPILSPSLNITRLSNWSSLVSKIVSSPNEWRPDPGGRPGVFLWENDHAAWSPSKLWSDTTVLKQATSVALINGVWNFNRDANAGPIGLYYKPADGKLPNFSSRAVYLDLKNSIIGAHQSSYLIISDLAFEYAGNGVVNDVYPSGKVGPGSQVHNFAVVNSTFRNMNIPVEVRSRKYNGASFEPRNLAFIGNTMADIGSYGIRLESANGPTGFYNVLIDSNTITNIAINGSHLPANPSDVEVISIQNPNNIQITRNTIVHGLKEADGIGVRSVDGRSFFCSGIIIFRHADRVLRAINISGNFVSDVSQGIVIGTGPADMNRGIVIANNIVTESESGLRLAGTDTTNASFTVHNTLYKNGVSIAASPLRGQAMIGNLSVSPTKFHMVINSFEGTSDVNYNGYFPDGALFKSENNNPLLEVVFSNFSGWQAFTVIPDASGVIGANPQFVTATPKNPDNFKLSALSSALDVLPFSNSHVSGDFEGRSRAADLFSDVGAWERQSGD